MDNGGTVEAHEIWWYIKDRFGKADGTKKRLALSKFSLKRCVVYKKIMCSLTEAGINMQDDVLCARLLEALPSSWEPFRQTWTGRDVEHQHIETLIELIQTNALRQAATYDNNFEATAMLSGVGGPRRNVSRRRNFRRTITRRSSSSHTEVVCYNCNRRGHIQSECRAPRRNNNGNQHRGNNSRQNNSTNRNNDTRPSNTYNNPQVGLRTQPRAHIAEAYNVDTNYVDHEDNTLGEEYIVDSGTNRRMSNNRSFMINNIPNQEKREVKLGGSMALSAQGPWNT